MRRFVFSIILLAALALGAFYAGAESATSSKLRLEREPAETPAQLPHSSGSNCAKCHEPHALGKEHRQVTCAACHIGESGLREAISACADCHEEGSDAAPKLSIYRGVNYRYKLRQPDEMLQPACGDCHQDSMYNRAITPLVHPVRSVGSHIACDRCHDISKDKARADGSAKWDYPEKLCGECHQDVVRQFALNEPHSLVRRNVRCRQCHPPHEQFRANLTVDNLQLMGKQALAAYDPISSNELCLRCHNYLTLTGKDTRFALTGGISLHQMHIELNYASCVECHNPHQASSRGMVREMTLDGEPFLHFAMENGGSCAVKCHAHEHRSAGYLPQT